MSKLCYICEDCREKIGDMPILAITVIVPTKCDICGDKDAVHVVNQHDLLWIMQELPERIK